MTDACSISYVAGGPFTCSYDIMFFLKEEKDIQISRRDNAFIRIISYMYNDHVYYSIV